MPSDLARLPPLDLLRGFVAVGRRMSITLAARDLHLTQSAISRQVRALEDHMGVALLTRGFRSVSFTAEGAQLFRLADPWLTELAELVARSREPDRRAPITITTTMGVATLWLLPRLGAFQDRHPGMDVRVAADNRVLDLRREDIDIAIRYCTAAQAPADARRLFGEALVPVAHPSLRLRWLDRGTLSRHILLDFDGPAWPWLHWREWLDANGLAGQQPKGMLRLNQYDQIVHAALAGHGIALGRHVLVEPMLRDGRLAALGQPHAVGPDGPAYWLVRNPHAGGADADVVADWLAQQAEISRPEPAVHPRPSRR